MMVIPVIETRHSTRGAEAVFAKVSSDARLLFGKFPWLLPCLRELLEEILTLGRYQLGINDPKRSMHPHTLIGLKVLPSLVMQGQGKY